MSTPFFGGKNGGKNIASPLTDGAYDFIIVESGVTITVFEDSADYRDCKESFRGCFRVRKITEQRDRQEN